MKPTEQIEAMGRAHVYAPRLEADGLLVKGILLAEQMLVSGVPGPQKQQTVTNSHCTHDANHSWYQNTNE